MGTIQASMIYGQVASDNITGTLNNKALVGGSLNIGNGAFIVDNKGNVTIKSGNISWGTVTGTDALTKSISDAQAAAVNAHTAANAAQSTANTANSKAVSAYDRAGNAISLANAASGDVIALAKGEFTDAGTTFISGNNIYSPNISSPNITGGVLTSTTYSGNLQKDTIVTDSKITFHMTEKSSYGGSFGYDAGIIEAYVNDTGLPSSARTGLRIKALWNGDGYTGGLLLSAERGLVLQSVNQEIFFYTPSYPNGISLSTLAEGATGTAVFG